MHQGNQDPDPGGADGMPKGYAGAVHVDLFIVFFGNAHVLEVGYDLGGKGFLDLDEIDVFELRFRCRQDLPDGRAHGEVGPGGIGSRHFHGVHGDIRLYAHRLCLFGGHDHHGGGPVVFRGGVAGRTDPAHHRRKRCDLLECGFGPGGFILFHHLGTPLFLRHLHGDDLLVEQAVLPGAAGLLMAFKGPAVAFLPGDILLHGRGFRPGHHGRQNAVAVFGLAHDAGPLDAVVEGQPPDGQIAMPPGHSLFTADAPLDPAGKVELRVGHALHAPGHDDFSIAAADQGCRKADHLQAGAAALVQGESGNLLGPVRIQKRHAGDVDVFAVLVGLPHDHLVDLRDLDPGPGNRLVQDDGAQIVSLDGFQSAHVPADRGSHAACDDYFVWHLSHLR